MHEHAIGRVRVAPLPKPLEPLQRDKRSRGFAEGSPTPAEWMLHAALFQAYNVNPWMSAEA